MVVVTWSQEVQLPSKLQSLSLGEMFNHPLHRVTLPEKLQSLNFGRRRTNFKFVDFWGDGFWWVLWGRMDSCFKGGGCLS